MNVPKFYLSGFTHEYPIDPIQPLAEMDSIRGFAFNRAGSLLYFGYRWYCPDNVHRIYLSTESHHCLAKIHCRRLLDARDIMSSRCDPRGSPFPCSACHYTALVLFYA